MSVDLSEFTGDLDLDAINQILAGGREKGVYRQDALDFIASGKMGAPYQFSDKKGQSVKTGFESAVESILKDADVDDETKAAAKALIVKVRKQGEGESATEHVFLIRGDLVRAAKQGNTPQPEATEGEPAEATA